jgi:hypothetical protein
MRTCLIRANLWIEPLHSEALKDIIQNCVCTLARKPQLPPRVSLRTVDKGEELCIDVIYFEGIPHLHAEDKYSAFSACLKLRERSMSTQIETLQGMWINKYGAPKRISADQEYDNSIFHDYCKTMGTALFIIAAEAHHQNGVLESGNRVLRMFFNKITIAEKQLNMGQAVEQAVYGMNCCTGSKSASSYELWLEMPPRDPSSSSPVRAPFVAKQARSKIYKALRNENRNYTDVSPGQYVRFYREKRAGAPLAQLFRWPTI